MQLIGMDDICLIKHMRIGFYFIIALFLVITVSLLVDKWGFVRGFLGDEEYINVNVMGDSISHGAFSLDVYNNGWVRIFERSVNAWTGGESYGFTPISSLGSGETNSSDTHFVNYVGSHEPLPFSSMQSSVSPSGFVMRLSGVGARITFTIPDFQSFERFNYIQQPDGGKFDIYVNGVPVESVDSSGPLAWTYAEFVLLAARSNKHVVSIVTTGNEVVDIVGPSYLSWLPGPVFNNYSQSGRRLRDVGEQLISDIASDSSTLIIALGHNDQVDADKDDTYFREFSRRVDWIVRYANQRGVRVIVPDFCWTAPADSRTRAELRRLAAETSGLYVDLPGKLFEGRQPSVSYLVDDLKMWWEGSHPNQEGHAWIAQEITLAVQVAAGGDVKGWLQRGESRP